MGTNYYGRIIPTKEKKEELKNLIDTDDFTEIKAKVYEMYHGITPNYSNGFDGGEVHLGKRSGGWKFLWNPNCYVQRNGHTEWEEFPGGKSGHWVEDSQEIVYLYPLTKDGSKKFIDREDVVIYDEYGKKQDKEEFWKMALDWVTWNNEEAYDSKSYEIAHPNEDRWQCKNELIDMLAKEGYEFTSWTQSDFYSDGLRFSTSTDFL